MSRAPALDALRGVAALAIVALHAWLYTTTVAEKGDSLGDAVVHQLRLGVPLFFVLSGFLLYRSWVVAARGGRPLPRLGTYARRRAARVVPAYAAALLGSLLLLAPLADVRGVDIPPLHALPLFAVFASNLSPATTGALDPPMWTLAVEVQFYVLLPVLAWLALDAPERRDTRVPGTARLLAPPLVLLAGGTLFNLAHAVGAGSIVVATSLPALAPCFACGMAAAVLAERPTVRRRPPGVRILVLLAAAALVVLDGGWHEADAGYAGRILRDLPAAAGFAAVILVAAQARGTTARVLATAPFRVLGALSFPVYLWHMPLMLGLRGAHVFPEHHPAAAFAAVLAVTLPVAWLSWTFVERPGIRWAAARERRPGPGRESRRPHLAERPQPADRPHLLVREPSPAAATATATAH
ncbi:acyltransferase [Paraconexibacter antarcticus]|uniref:Acyltransferase n=1 Tax=Paraconexibacter antarcticus TaxID=2949664 RepID=A0ABY5DN55_9ACTN|nr:acyltransferase [Paraconexibacter antarcticus]UTI62354.1 acyltransferase [Paraconexibacter antarcticus]